MQHRAVGRGDQGNLARVSGQGPLAGRIEQALGGELVFHRLESPTQLAFTGRFDIVADQLHVTPGGVDRHATTNQETLTLGK